MWTLALTAAVGAARAQDLCGDVDHLIDQSRSAFAEIVDAPNGEPGEHDVTITLADATNCLVTVKAERTWYQCVWEFPLRAKQAYDRFEALAGEMDECFGQRATLHTDRSVNHPDFYSLRRYDMAQADVSVSVKDKSALGETFVFIVLQGKQAR